MGGRREGFKHHAWPDDGPEVGREELEELAEPGLLRVEYLERAWMVAPTREAQDNVAEYEGELARAERAEAVDVSWAVVRPVLHGTGRCLGAPRRVAERVDLRRRSGP